MTPDGPIDSDGDLVDKFGMPLSEVMSIFEVGRACGAIGQRKDDSYFRGYADAVEWCLKETPPEPWRSTNYRTGRLRRRSLTHPNGRAR